MRGRRVRLRASRPATACARGTSIRMTHTRLPRYARGRVGVIECVRGCHVFPGQRRDRPGREPAVALHGGVRGPRIVGRGRRSDAQGLDRRLGALSGAGMTAIDPIAARRAAEAVPGIPRDARGAGVSRAVGGAGLRHGAGAARARAVHLDRVGRDARPTRSSARRPPAIPTPARPITGTGSTRWSAWSPRRAIADARDVCIAITMPGTTRPIARRTAHRSS